MARQMTLSVERAKDAVAALRELPVGGTAVGTGINTHGRFGSLVAQKLSEQTSIEFIEAVDHFEANGRRDALVQAHGLLRTIAASLFALADNIRWLGSGPRCGFYEVRLPDRQPGSSIMPGKVNPVLCEAAMQAAARVMGGDQTIAIAGAAGGHFQLNIMMPMMGDVAIESVELLTGATRALLDFCLAEMEPNEEACRAAVEQSLAMATALNPKIGYEEAARIAKEAFRSGRTVREVCESEGVLPPDELEETLDPRNMLRPGE